MPMKYEVGQSYERWTPFIVEDKELSGFDEDGGWSRPIKHWRPGVNNKFIAPDARAPVWDGDGAELRRIVAVVKIEGGGVRILYRRTWRRPDGGEFGKARVRMTTPSAFSAWRNGRNSSLWRDLQDYRTDQIGELEAAE